MSNSSLACQPCRVGGCPWYLLSIFLFTCLCSQDPGSGNILGRQYFKRCRRLYLGRKYWAVYHLYLRAVLHFGAMLTGLESSDFKVDVSSVARVYAYQLVPQDNVL